MFRPSRYVAVVCASESCRPPPAGARAGRAPAGGGARSEVSEGIRGCKEASAAREMCITYKHEISDYNLKNLLRRSIVSQRPARAPAQASSSCETRLRCAFEWNSPFFPFESTYGLIAGLARAALLRQPRTADASAAGTGRTRTAFDSGGLTPGNCGAMCGCRKAGMKCSAVCFHCSGETCSNVMELSELINENDFDDEPPTLTFPPVLSLVFNSETRSDAEHNVQLRRKIND
ncbi:hypothetical protein EVAR_82158_1 [Eumeta japonica]|uniref:Tesmin/TSO1-like CXC domain-containing protein n=1 Tax=Eumeta variegata TaxID=151549 RepID=A0A4C1U2J6_EUMVA|nr:hypothetical protein EVAR_82158_1 [Eumeta japonica]